MAARKQSKPALLDEVNSLRRQVAKLQAAIARGKRAEATLRSHTRQLRTLRAGGAELPAILEKIPLIMMLVDRERRIRIANTAAADYAGLPKEQIVGWPAGVAVGCVYALDGEQSCGAGPECETCEVGRAIVDTFDKGRCAERLEATVPVRRKDSTQDGVFLVSTAPVRIGRDDLALVCIEDVTTYSQAAEYQRELESRVRDAQKAESLRIVTGGIAHDFNNLLAGIMGYADLLLMSLVQPSAARESVEKLKRAAVRASELANQMLVYAGADRLVTETVNLNELVEEMAHLLKVSISRKITLELSLADSLPAIEADAQQIRQVVMNLITNASQAIGDNTGLITIRTDTTETKAEELSDYHPRGELKAARYVFLEVSDTGCGMDKKTVTQIFEPFFTTKLAGRGLGLAAVLGITREHEGAIRVHSQVGKGTNFRMLLPPSERAPKPMLAERPAEPPVTWRGKGTILVVDDEDAIRDVAKTVLERSGFAVLTAANGREGVELFREHSNDITAVLLDVTMPQLSGQEAFEQILGIRADAKVVLASGYPEQNAIGGCVGAKAAGFIQKPFQLDALLRKLREVIERP